MFLTRAWRERQGQGLKLLTTVVISIVYLLAGILCTCETRNARAATGPTIGGCPLFPANNIWNTDISALPVSLNSASYVASIGLTGHIHADFGSGTYNGSPIGIPYVVVPGNQATVPVQFDYSGESDPGPYPIPSNAPIEGGAQSTGDRHVLIVNSGTCKLYEMFAAYPQSNGSWHAGSGAVWNLNSNALRPASWTSADAAGLSILAGLVRYDEVAAGVINHAIRFTVAVTQKAYIWPARHYASSNTNLAVPPMGLRLRLKASVDISGFSPQNQIILTALKHYGMIVADNGANWFIGGAPDDRWNNDDLAQLRSIVGSDFEAVDESGLQVDPNSGQALGAPAVVPTPTSPAQTPIPTASTPTPGTSATPTGGASSTPVSTPTRSTITGIAPLPTATPKSIAKGGGIMRDTSTSAPTTGGGTNMPLTLVIIGGVLLLVGLIIGQVIKRRARRPQLSHK